MVDISHSHLYYIEKKSVIPSIDLVFKLAKALNTDIRSLMEWEKYFHDNKKIVISKAKPIFPLYI